MHIFRFSLMFGAAAAAVINLPRFLDVMHPSKWGLAGHEAHTAEEAAAARMQAKVEAGVYKGLKGELFEMEVRMHSLHEAHGPRGLRMHRSLIEACMASCR